MPFFGAASGADGDTRLGVSLRCIQDEERRCLVPTEQDIVPHLFLGCFTALAPQRHWCCVITIAIYRRMWPKLVAKGPVLPKWLL